MLPTFLLGCQRSGTTALLDTLALSAGLRTFSEGDAAVMKDCRLLPASRVQQVLAGGNGPAVLKPIVDSHYADLILQTFPDSRVLWLYRQPRDVAGSILRKWPGHMREVAAKLRRRDLSWLDWRAERLSADQWHMLDALGHPELNESDCAAIFWWLRNQWFFAQNLAGHPNVMLVNYEELVSDPLVRLPQICRFVRTPYTPKMADSLRAEHIDKDHDLELVAPVARVCDELLARLDIARVKGAAP